MNLGTYPQPETAASPLEVLGPVSSLAAEAYDAYQRAHIGHEKDPGTRAATAFVKLPEREQNAWCAAANELIRQVTALTCVLSSQRQADAERTMQLCVSAAVEGATTTALRAVWPRSADGEDEE